MAWGASETIDVARTALSARWPSVTGSILASSEQLDFVGTHVGRYSNRPTRERRLHLTYAYTVNGQSYQSSQVTVMAPYVRIPSRRVVEQYATGRSVVVHYDPGEPATAVIDTTIPWGRCIQIVIATAILVLTWTGTQSRHARPHPAV